IPMLMAAAAIHHALIDAGLRTKAALVCDTGEPREDHHYACLLGYGVALIHPYLAYASAKAIAEKEGGDSQKAAANYKKAVEKGIFKIMSKMGISTVSSYRGAQIFEAIGLHQEVISEYFKGTPNKIGGVTLKGICDDVLNLHADAFGQHPELKDMGIYRFRKEGEYHALNPQVFKALHKAVRTESFEAFGEYIQAVDERPASSLRDLLAYKKALKAIPLDEVEPVEAIVKRFTTQAMSHGSVSRETHETIAIAMNRLGAKSNSGEGGEAEDRFYPYQEDQDPKRYGYGPWAPKKGDWGNSAIKQVASGRFGVTPEYLISAQELEIKMAQGAKPGEGGQLPGHKVNEEIAKVRRSVPGVTLISPPPHHDIYSIEDLAQLIYDLKRINREARVCVKLVSTDGVGTIAAGVVKGYADNIQISGHDGGTGASPLSSIKHAGTPWELGLAETHQVLVDNDLRARVRLRVDGGIKTGRDVVIAALLGAEEYGFGTTALVAAGCAMIRQCHLNSCPVGVATQRPDLRAKYTGQPEHVVNFLVYVAQQVRMLLAEMGFRSLDEIIGHVHLLEKKEHLALPKDAKFDLTPILKDVDPTNTKPNRCLEPRNNRPEPRVLLDDMIVEDAKAALERQEKVQKRYNISNYERSVGARLSGEIAKRYSAKGLPAGTIEFSFEGSSGQSFGVWNNRGVRLILEGEAQDYVGKGMYGGEIIVRLPKHSQLKSYEHAIIGNTVMYGATGGSLYAAGQAGERLCVRNSGGYAVVEGCGDHGCEYMTGGVAVILGKTGRNFGAGMSGGVAYIYDIDGKFEQRYNPGMVSLERLDNLSEDSIDERLLRVMLERHLEMTQSQRAKEILNDWANQLKKFCKIVPHPGVEDATAKEQDEKVLEHNALAAISREAGQNQEVVMSVSA
ncbi:MAG: glutamate synthase large subunit, partial [Deinococcales bacterium]